MTISLLSKASTNAAFVLCLMILTSGNAQNTHYWQQAQKTYMKIDMNVETHQYHGYMELDYQNNSPDALDELYFHLFLNAFQPGSMMDIRSRTISDPDSRVGDRISQLKEDEIGYIKIERAEQGNSMLEFETIGTILRITLDEAIEPGSSTKLILHWNAQTPIQIRRTGRDNAEGISYSMSQWYPRICAYDENGWNTDPYIGREFYGDWGDFKVEINISSDYMVAATGVLQNVEEIGMGYSSDLPKKKRKSHTWKFEANNVHDFVWAADPDYVHKTIETDDGVMLHFFYQEGEGTEAWLNLPAAMKEAFNYINTHFGKYPYPVYSFIQGGDGGMEYPMATLIRGNRELRSLVGVSVHELMHSWYQMMLATNEARYAWMDEGFTSYASTEVMNYLVEKRLIPGELKPHAELHLSNIRGFCNFTRSGLEEPLSTYADHFNTNTAYSVASYVKGSVFLSQLSYIMGQENLDTLLLDYFDTWRFKHPEPKDLLRMAERQSGFNLDWFGMYFINTTRTMDYAIDSLYQEDDIVLRIRRKGIFPMPVDLLVEMKDGQRKYYTIPLRSMLGAKQKEGEINYEVLESWPWVDPLYSVRLPIKLQNVAKIVIDPSERMADIDLENNVLIVE